MELYGIVEGDHDGSHVRDKLFHKRQDCVNVIKAHVRLFVGSDQEYTRDNYIKYFWSNNYGEYITIKTFTYEQ